MRPYYILKLEDGFHSRKERNSSYSLRAYSHFLGMYSGTLSAVIKGKRPLPQKTAHSVVEKLCLSPEEKELFFESVKDFRQNKPRSSTPSNDSPQVDLVLGEAQFHIISEWEHYAVLSLIVTDGFISDNSWMAQKLGITEERIERVLENLMHADLITKNDEDQWVNTYERLDTKNDIGSPAIKKSHAETLRIAGEKVETIGPEHRYYGHETMAIDRDQIPAAKELIRRFKADLGKLVGGKKKDDVYRFAIQFFPLTNLNFNLEGEPNEKL